MHSFPLQTLFILISSPCSYIISGKFNVGQIERLKAFLYTIEVDETGAEIRFSIGAFVPSSDLIHSHFLPCKYIVSGKFNVGQIERLKIFLYTLEVDENGTKIRFAIYAFVLSLHLIHSHFLPCRYMASRNHTVCQIEQSRAHFDMLEMGKDGILEARFVIGALILSPGRSCMFPPLQVYGQRKLYPLPN